MFFFNSITFLFHECNTFSVCVTYFLWVAFGLVWFWFIWSGLCLLSERLPQIPGGPWLSFQDSEQRTKKLSGRESMIVDVSFLYLWFSNKTSWLKEIKETQISILKLCGRKPKVIILTILRRSYCEAKVTCF